MNGDIDIDSNILYMFMDFLQQSKFICMKYAFEESVINLQTLQY